jgi:hypothetical protein
VHLLLWKELLQLLHQWALGYASRPHAGAKRDAALLPVRPSNGDAAIFYFHHLAVQHQLSACEYSNSVILLYNLLIGM